jgi:hypothetical protein
MDEPWRTYQARLNERADVLLDRVQSVGSHASQQKILAVTAEFSRATHQKGWQDRNDELGRRARAATALYPKIRDHGSPRIEDPPAGHELEIAGRLFERSFLQELHHSGAPRKLARRMLGVSLGSWSAMRGSIYRALQAIDYEGLESYVKEVIDYLGVHLPKTFDALPFQSVSQAAVSKILRGFFGVHWYARADSVGGLRLLDAAPGRRELFDLAYAYGASYALIDNLIDTDFFRSPQDRDYFLDVILRAMDGADATTLAPKAPYAKELASLWRDVSPTLARRPLLRSWLTELVRAQRADACMTHAALAELPSDEASRLLLRAGMMKASWTRISAKAIATDKGFADPDCVLFAGLNNQLSNDLEGLASDDRFGAVTTFTHQCRTRRNDFDAIGMMLTCAAHSVDYMSQRFQFPDAALVDAFVVRLLESAAELQYSVGPARYGELLSQCSAGSPSLQSQHLIAALSSIGPAPPVAHQEMLLLGGADDYALKLWLNRRGRQNMARRLIVEVSERHGIALERFIHAQELSPCARYAMTGDCGRFRPYLLLVLAGLVGLAESAAMAYAVAIECFHSASLILDDLPAQDNADVRRGKPTAHLAFGEATAQLAVVELIALGFSLIGQPVNAPGHAGGRLVKEAHRCLAGRDGLCHGQLRDLEMRNLDVSADQWVLIASAKTGQPLLFCILVPLIASGAPRDAEVLSQMGVDLGVLFQVRDDLADRPSAPWAAQLKTVAVAARQRCATRAEPVDERWGAVHRFLVSLAEEMHDQIDRYSTSDAANAAPSLDQPLWG